jgi:enoyl-[acyl-carrier-protein] reductase (NADH)
MNVKPVGTFKGRKAIGDFWKKMVNESKASFLVYRNTRIKQINENTVHLASDWTMNIGEGIITKEEWVKGKDGIWKFKSDSFEIKKQY